MIKRVFSLALTLMCVMLMSAQMPSPLPLNPKVRSGVLPNGLSYYILHNEEPKERANFYIAQKVGSTLETPEQYGLAHFLEHMAFNGSKNFPGKNMLEYLQANGIRFGADINAYTAYDETVYNIDNVPTTNENLMDSVLLVLHDWSGSLSLEDDEIEAERKVIQEEWRMRDVAMMRAYQNLYKNVFQEPQYQMTPIGTMEVVMNFPPDVLRDYYHKWYRPDQQGIVIVGDFDAELMEKKVIDLFSTIPMPENAPERTYPTVSDNAEPIYFEYEEPELDRISAVLSYKFEKTPWEMRNTDAGYVQDYILFNVLSSMINQRLSDNANNPDCTYAGAFFQFGDYFVAKTKGAVNIYCVAKSDIQAALKEVMAIVMGAIKGGFNQTELDRVNAEFLSDLEKQYNERDKTKTTILARDLIRHFVDNTPDPGIEIEYQLAQQVVPNIPLEAYNSILIQLLSSTNYTLAITQPQREGMSLPGREAMVEIVGNAMAAEYEAVVEEAITDPLIDQLPAKGSIVAVDENGDYGTQVFTLSNGVKVVVKPTDYASDEIILSAVAKGGKAALDASQASDLLFADFSSVNFNKFDSKTLDKYLAGKKASLGFDVENVNYALNGNSTAKDLPTLMELVYTAFTNISPDQNSFDATKAQITPIISNMEANNPDYIFQQEQIKTMYGGNPLAMVDMPSSQMIENATLPGAFSIVSNALKNAADYTFIFTGNVDVEALKPLLEQYIATLPSTGKAEAPVEKNGILKVVPGKVNNSFETKMSNPSTMILDVYSDTNMPVDALTSVNVGLLGSILSNMYTRVIREEKGGAYSPYAYGFYRPSTGQWVILSEIQTNAEQQDEMAQLANQLFLDLMKDGATAEDFNKVRGAAINQLEKNQKTNPYWSQNLTSAALGYDIFSGKMDALQNLTLDDFNAWIKNLYNGNNRVTVLRNGVAK